MQKVIIAGGGTGGHISPGIALYEEFNRRGIGTVFLVSKRDKRFSSLKLIDKKDLVYYGAPTLSKNIFKMLFFVFFFGKALLRSISLIKKHNANAMIGMGGYVSAPALLAARIKKVPIFLCEQNTVPGRVTSMFDDKAMCIFGTFEQSLDYIKNKKKFIHAGNPIRKDVITNIPKSEAQKYYHLDHCKFVILAIGGSQGALKINDLIFNLKKDYSDELKNVGIIWSTGAYSYEIFKEKIQKEMDAGSIYLSSFIDNVGYAYAASDVAISRSGAGVMMELAAMKLPSILIPYPHAAMDHQDKNARVFSDNGAAITVKNSDATADAIAPLLFDLMQNERKLGKMSEQAYSMARKNAAQVICDHILSLVSIERKTDNSPMIDADVEFNVSENSQQKSND